MNNPKQTHTPPRRTLLRSFVSLFALSASLVATTRAADWYLKANQGASNSWLTPPSDWTANADGTGANPASISAADTFDTNNLQLRTPAVTASTTFTGGVLRLTGGASVIGMKTGGTAIAIVPKLVSTGGTVENWGGGVQYFQANDYENRSGFTSFKAAAGRSLKVTLGKLTGSGETRLLGDGTIRLDASDAERYLGTVRVSTGAVDFDNNVFTSGPLVVETGATVVLDQAVSFAGLTVAGTEYPPGNYTFAALQAAQPAVFVTGTVGGSITVRAPRNWYLTVSQGTQNWTETYLANWNSAANGSGVAPTTINGYDTYIDQVSNREIRTPATVSTFAGGALALANGAKLTLKSNVNVVSTIPAFVNTNSPVIVNGGGNFRQNLAVGDWEITSGITKLSVATGRSIGVTIDYLTGTGGIQTQSGGAFFMSISNGSGYTGTLDHASGSLRFETPSSTRGAFNVGSSATVTLDHAIYFPSVTIAGAAQPVGIQTYATLNAAYPVQFPAGSAAGLIGVYVPAAAPVPMHGVNISGPESNTANLPGTYGYNYVYPTVADFDYYHAKGLNLIRIPFRWERMQHGLNVPLDTAQLGYMDTAIARASARGMKVILDMHNYAECNVSGVKYRFGSAGLPDSAFADVWRRLADHYKNEPAIYGYDIMNEPNGLGAGVWVTYAQAAIYAIREVDLNHDIIVEGESWANAWGFETKNPSLHTVRDPVGRLMFSAHSYWSDKGTDEYKTYDAEAADPQMGVTNVKPFVDWLKKYGFKGYVGEYGVPNDDPRWNVALENFLDYLDAEGISGTYWAAGAWYSGNPISCQPSSNYTVDRAVMSVLQTHP